MSQPIDFAVFIGRFQPFHRGHQHIISTALSQAKQVIVLCGSANRVTSLRNPWSFSERKIYISAAFSADEQARLHILPLDDSPYNQSVWLACVQRQVGQVVAASGLTQARIALVGLSDEGSDYYPNSFPQWQTLAVKSDFSIHSSQIRAHLFNQAASLDSDAVYDALPSNVHEFIQSYTQSEACLALQQEQTFIRSYQSAWQSAPYPPIFQTVDAVVVQSGHILLIERRAQPGKGLLALPGGFLDPHEPLVTACLRELREETRLKVPQAVLQGSIIKQAVYDDPFRSARGRTLTQAFLFQLRPDRSLPKVKGGDDAAKAFWLPLGELRPEKLFEDHYFIIQDLLGF